MFESIFNVSNDDFLRNSALYSLSVVINRGTVIIRISRRIPALRGTGPLQCVGEAFAAGKEPRPEPDRGLLIGRRCGHRLCSNRLESQSTGKSLFSMFSPLRYTSQTGLRSF